MIKFDLNNRVAVVTGGAQGFGLAITERFIEAGAKVVIWDIDENAAKEAIDKVKSEHLNHQIVDVTNFEIVKKNLEEGRGFSIAKEMSKDRGTSYQFASSNPMWRATLDILDFLPLANVDYSGGIITTDWYNEGTSSDESIKITVRFLTNEVRADGLKIIVHKKKCSSPQNCKTVLQENSKIISELRNSILLQASTFEKEKKKKSKRESKSFEGKILKKKITYAFHLT